MTFSNALLSRSARPHRGASLVLLAVLLGSAPNAFADAQPANGDVVRGLEVEGPALLRARIPTRPLLVTVDSPYEVFASGGTLIHVAAWTADGAPARGADVYFETELVGRTDEYGTLVFRWGVPGEEAASWRRGGLIAVRWEQAGVLYGGDVSFNANRRTGSFASDHVFVYTDRGIYNPGEAVRVRALAWHLAADYAPLEGAALEFLLRNAAGDVVSASSASTNVWGVTALELPVAAHLAEGVYTLSATYEDATAEARLRIERFTPPVIRIEHTLGRYLTPSQRGITFDVTLGYFTDAAFEGGELAVDFSVAGTSRYRTSMAIAGPGPHTITVDAEALAAIRAGLRERDVVEVEIAATDVYGRRDDLTRELTFFFNPYIVVIEKDRDYYSPGDPVELIVRLSDRDRVPVRQREVTLHSSTGATLTGLSDETGMVQFSLTMPESELRVEVLLEDVGAAVATANVPLQGAQPMRSHIADAIVREAAPAHVVVRFPSHFIPVEAVVHMDVVDTSGALVEAVLLPVRVDADGHYLAEGDLEAPSWGSMLLTFFCLGRDLSVVGSPGTGETFLGLMTEGQNLAVYPGRELTITLDGVPDELVPGEAFRGTVRVTDGAGEPVDAAVGAALVDMAVISLRDPLEITPMDHFYNPRLRVLSTTGSAILTWPVVSRNWGANRRDVALPPFPYRDGGAVDGVFDGERKVHFGENTDEDVPLDDELAMVPMGDSYSLVGEYGEMVLPEQLAQAPVITIRTEFPDTSLWEPYLEAPAGQAVLEGRVPDAITTQQFTLVASDRRGGVGVLRFPVRVSQPLFVRTDVPDDLTVGDAVTIRVVVENHGDRDESVEVTLAGEPLAVDGAAERLEVPAGGAAMALFRVEARRPGPVNLVASARSGRRQDLEERVVFVRPLGLPDLNVSAQTVTRDAGADFTVALPESGQMTAISLGVAFPAVSAGFAGFEAIRSRFASADVMAMSGDLLGAAYLYELQKAQGGPPARLVELRTQLERALAYLLSAQRSEGGWGYWWDAEAQPYVTAYVLEGLCTLDRVGLTVPRESLRRAVDYLATAHVDGVYDTAAVAFWEGSSDAVQLGLSAEIFATLAAIPSPARNAAWRRAMEAMAPRYEAYLDEPEVDVLTLAHAVLGLSALREAGLIELGDERLRAAADRLFHERREGYWEPSWFNAYGGTIEATLAALEVYAALGAEAMPAAQQRESLRYLLSTRDEWGAWHNPWGTAAAVRALILLDPGTETPGASVALSIDGREVRRVVLDADDPFLSVGALRDLDITPYLIPGEVHTVSVRYDGALEPEARLTVRHWPEPEAREGGTLSLRTSLSETRAAVDQVVRYRLRVGSDEGQARRVQIDVAAPSNAELDESSLGGLLERGLIDAYESRGSGWILLLSLDGREERELDLALVARRAGSATVPVAVAQALGVEHGDERLAVALIDEVLEVR